MGVKDEIEGENIGMSGGLGRTKIRSLSSLKYNFFEVDEILM